MDVSSWANLVLYDLAEIVLVIPFPFETAKAVPPKARTATAQPFCRLLTIEGYAHGPAALQYFVSMTPIGEAYRFCRSSESHKLANRARLRIATASDDRFLHITACDACRLSVILVLREVRQAMTGERSSCPRSGLSGGTYFSGWTYY